MRRRVVITQSMYFPWVGLLEQIRLADVVVHYDDVQFSKGSFTNRVQVKRPDGLTAWMTVPVRHLRLGQFINQVAIQDTACWLPRHRAMLQDAFEKASFRKEAMVLAEEVWLCHHATIAALSRSSMLALAEYFGLHAGTTLVNSSDLGIGGSGSRRIVDIMKAVDGNVYITGHGARNYLDHELLERAGIDVQYMQYECTEYPQLYGPFTPYVTALDLVANCGRDGAQVIRSGTVGWREFLRMPANAERTA